MHSPALYLVIGSHFPDIATALSTLRPYAAAAQTRLWHPDGLPLPDASAYSDFATLLDSLANAPDCADTCHFVILDPRADLPSSLQAAANALRAFPNALQRIIAIADCTAIAEHASALSFYEACAWYADVMLLGNRTHAPRKVVADFQKALAHACYPTLLALLKSNGKVEDAPAILFPEARRPSQLFDFDDDAAAAPATDPNGLPIIIDASCDLDVDLDESAPDPFLDTDEGNHPPRKIPTASAFIVTA